jgi:hypothetical protein
MIEEKDRSVRLVFDVIRLILGLSFILWLGIAWQRSKDKEETPADSTFTHDAQINRPMTPSDFYSEMELLEGNDRDVWEPNPFLFGPPMPVTNETLPRYEKEGAGLPPPYASIEYPTETNALLQDVRVDIQDDRAQSPSSSSLSPPQPNVSTSASA